MESRILETFLVVAKVQSLSKATAALQVAQSSVSRHIAQLEHDCGGHLFHRTGRGVALTALGEVIHPLAKRVLESIAALEAEAAAHTGMASGEVRVGLLPIVASAISARMFKEVKSSHPQISISIVEAYSGDLEEWLESGRLDLALTFFGGSALPKHKEVLAQVDACVVSAPSSPFTTSPTLDFDALVDVPLVLATKPNSLRTLIAQICEDRGVTLHPVVEANSFSVELQLIQTAGCCSITPFFAVADQVAAGTLQASLLVNPAIQRWLTLEITPQRPSSTATRKVAEVIRSIIQELQADHYWTKSVTSS